MEWTRRANRSDNRALIFLFYSHHSVMSPGVRMFSLLLLLFLGLFAPCALADFATCKAGWEWVSDQSAFSSIPRRFSHKPDFRSPSQANNTLVQNPCQIAGALEASCEGFCTFEQTYPTPSKSLTSCAAAYVLGPLASGTNYVTPQKNSSSQKCQCNTVMFR